MRELTDPTRASAGSKGRWGFSVIELLIALVIAGALLGMAFPRFDHYRSVRAAVNARDAFTMAAARARSAAVEKGDVVVLMIRPYHDSVFVMTGDAQDTLEVLDYRSGQFPADLLMDTGLPAPFRICYLARGFAHPSCGDGEHLPVKLGFRTNGVTMWSDINATGQVER